MKRRRRGLTLVELLIVLAITVMLASALGWAFTAELTMQRVQEARRADLDRSDRTEREITRLLRGAKLSPTPAAPSAPPPATTDPAAGGLAAAAVPTSYFQGTTENGASDLGCDRLTFTSTAPAIPLAALDGKDDFETQQAARGPVGGLAEVSLSTTPVGDPGGRTGLFERVQRPGDTDPTQGGFESVLDPQIARLGFEFWDGLEWVAAWDATNPRRLPQAVRVSYTLRGRPDGAVRVFVVPIPASDVDAETPMSAGGSQ